MKNHLLSAKDIEKMLTELPEWELIENKIARTIHFANFIDAFAFMTKVAIISEAMGHHPEWSNSYSIVKIKLTTHDLGGLSKFDIELARSINKLIKDI